MTKGDKLTIQKWPFIFVAVILFFPKGAIAQDLETISKERPVSVRGGISANGIFYNSKRENPTRQPFSWLLTGNANVSVYNTVEVPFSFVISERERSFRQSFNQFGLSPRYKWLTAHFGYRNIYYSRYTLAGHTFLGGGIEANPGIFRSGFIYGRFLKPIELDTISDFDVEPVNERKGYALKLGVGKNQNYVDFILFKAKDDPSSLQTPDSLLYKSPGENLVLGLKTRQIILKKISFDADFGASAYTLDVDAPSIEMPDNFFLNLASGIYTPNQSTEVLFAGNASLGINFKVVNLALKYTRIEPDYKSMGSNYFMTDIENFTINSSFNIFKRKLRFNLSYGVQRNNLSGKRDKNALRKIGSGNISYNPNQNLGFTLSYQNYRINQTNYRRIELDTFKLEQFTSNLAFNTNIRFGPRDFLHALRLNVNNQSFKTDQAEIDLANNSSLFNGGINYHYNNKPGKYSIRGGTNFNDFKRIDTKRFRMGWTIGGSKSQMDNKFRILLNFSYYQITLNKQKDGNTLAIRGQ